MTAPTVTLGDLTRDLFLCDMSNETARQYAALVRAAAKVVEAARVYRGWAGEDDVPWHPLYESLDAFDKISRGEA